MGNYYSISPQLYDDQFWWKKDDLEFWKNKLFHTNKRVLELAAGTGRIGLPLIKSGVQYTGLELSKNFVSFANKKAAYLTCSPFVVGDMRSFNYKKKFDVIFIGFNSFLHLLNKDDISKCLSRIKKHMHRSSFFYLDIFVPHPLFLYRPPNQQLSVLEFYDSSKKWYTNIFETVSYNPQTKIIYVIWKYINDKNICYNKFKFQMKVLYPESLTLLLNQCGFKIKNIWGSYSGDPLSPKSNLQIYKCALL